MDEDNIINFLDKISEKKKEEITIRFLDIAIDLFENKTDDLYNKSNRKTPRLLNYGNKVIDIVKKIYKNNNYNHKYNDQL